MHISLRANEKLYLNGAVIRPDRKVSIELLTDAVFLLEAHVMQPEQACTPLKNLYFITQRLLLDPTNSSTVMTMFEANVRKLEVILETPTLVEGVRATKVAVRAGRYFEGLRILRGLFEVESRILGHDNGPAMAESA